MRCGECQYYSVAVDKRGRRVLRADRMFPCVAPVPEPIFPDSVKRAYNFRWPPSRSYMSPNGGTSCAMFG